MSDRPSYGLTFRFGEWVVVKRTHGGLTHLQSAADLQVVLERAQLDAGMPLMIPLVPAP